MWANENALIALSAAISIPLGNSTTWIGVSFFKFSGTWNHDTSEKMVFQEFGNRDVITLKTRDGIRDISHELAHLLVV